MIKEPVTVLKNGRYEHVIEHSTEQIAAYIERASPQNKYEFRDINGELLCTTIGNFLNRVPNQKWLVQELQPLLVKMQFNEIEIPKVPIYTREQINYEGGIPISPLARAKKYDWMKQTFQEWGLEKVTRQLSRLSEEDIDSYELMDHLLQLPAQKLFSSEEEVIQFAYFHPKAAKRTFETVLEQMGKQLNPFEDTMYFGRMMYRQSLEEMYNGIDYQNEFTDIIVFDDATVEKIVDDASIKNNQQFLSSYFTGSEEMVPVADEKIEIDMTSKKEQKKNDEHDLEL
ncbi:hypothetical protein AF435_04575 [Listeria monocytogenes]|uniref:Uncharacterized protein n=1 Tax=Listeria monocytogenes TaxID=1639 RepID=A0AAN2WF14_LISMN|nr:hypothetical protein [Listeria monocytogenes]EAC3367767.1 hypothetical protein [Listeria monocytogenes]EAC7084995.1 hypothetical protein [Listeria monocytogenes]EAC8542022.1 hypothetical protein [Listeria monocytogenes]EAC8548023.1 hypothetical protein [Listeria monocytogenes]